MSSHTSVFQRAFAFTMAGVFLISACALSGFVIYDMYQTRKNNEAAVAAQEKALKGKQLENFTPVETADQLQIIDTQVGDGEAVMTGDTVTADYTGAIAATGIIFESSKDSGQPATFPLDQVIDGWKEGLVGMKVGGTRRLVIPAAMAYGANPPQGSGIPANAALVFDVTLVNTLRASETSEEPAQ